jgi:hypothetical protein
MHGVLRGACHRSTVPPHSATHLRFKGALAACAAALLVLCPVHAAAPFRVIAKAGDWEAFAGILGNGQKVCGITTKGNGRWIDIRYVEGDSKVIIQLGKDSWKVTDDVKVNVAMSIDNHPALTGQAVAVHPDAGGVGLQFSINSKSELQFTKDFAAGQALAVHFPKDSQIEDWTADISASQKIAQSWSWCLSRMDNVE